MRPEEFCYWLQGYFELTEEDGGMSAKQVEKVKNHLALVFAHVIDPSYTEGMPEGVGKIWQEVLDSIHEKGAPKPKSPVDGDLPNASPWKRPSSNGIKFRC